MTRKEMILHREAYIAFLMNLHKHFKLVKSVLQVLFNEH